MASLFNDDDFDKTVRTVWGEAANEGPDGWKAVAAVIRNRANSSGMSPSQVVLAPNQFEPWGHRRRQLESLSPGSPDYQRIAQAIRPIFYGEADDPTQGATHFYAPRAQAALGRRPPSWDNGTGFDVGNHRFFRLGYGGSPPPPGQQPASSPPPTLASTLTGRPQPMPYDEYTPPDVIARQQRFGDQMRSMDPGTGKLSGLAAALGALGGVYGNYKADSYSRGNQRMQQDVYKNAMGAPDAEGVARALIGSGVPDAQKSGLALLLQERDPNKQLERQMKQLQIDELKRNMTESDLLFGGGRPAPSPAPPSSATPPAPAGAPPTPATASQPATSPVQAPGITLSQKIAQLPPDKQLALRKAYREKSPKFYEMLDEFLDPGKKAREAGEAARAKEVAEAQGKAIANLPVAIQGAERMIKQIDEVLNDKNLKNVTGPIQGALPTIRGKSVATEERIKQIQGSVFLRAFETLKGGGTITEVEGAKAEQALARLKNLRQDDKEYVKALEEARQEVKDLIDLAKDKTLGLTPQATTARAQAREAIRKGADRNAVIERLKQNSVDTSGL